MADGDDAARQGHVLAAVRGPRQDRAPDLVEPRLDGPGLGVQFLGPVVVEVAELLLPGLQPLDLGRLLVGGVRRLGMDAPVAGGVLPGHLGHGGGPLPAGRELVGGRLEPFAREPLEERGILEPGAGLVVLREEVADHRAAGGLVGLDADEAGEGRGARHALLRQEPPHLPGGGRVALRGDLLPDRHLARPVGGDGEGLEDLQVDLPGAEGVQQVGRDAAQAEPLLDGALGRAEARRDGRDRLPGLGELREGDDLVGGVHGDADDVLGERDLLCVDLAGQDLAGHGAVGIDGPVLGQRLQGLEAASAGDDGVAPVAVLADDEVLQEPERGDRGLELGVGLGAGRRPADVPGGGEEPVQRDLADGRSGRGCDDVHACLRSLTILRGADGFLRPRPAPAPEPPRPAFSGCKPGCRPRGKVWRRCGQARRIGRGRRRAVLAAAEVGRSGRVACRRRRPVRWADSSRRRAVLSRRGPPLGGDPDALAPGRGVTPGAVGVPVVDPDQRKRGLGLRGNRSTPCR